MKKYLFGGIAVLVIAAAVAFNVNINTKKSNLSPLSLANIEALAQESNSNDRSECSVNWTANVAGQTVVLSCQASCPSGQRAECKQNNCKCVSA